MIMDKYMWVVYAAAAGLCWGTYVPFVQQGIRGLQSPYGSFLCVGVAYFLIAVLFPLGLFFSNVEKQPSWNATGIVFATLAGTAGALGALCVIFANGATRGQPEYRLYIAPVIFALAPALNTIISLLWHPSPSGVFHFGWEHSPGWKFYVGILLTGLGAALVLYAKEETETAARVQSPAPAVASRPNE
jgi:hypothetical protein